MPGYLQGGYLQDPYLTGSVAAQDGFGFQARMLRSGGFGFQANMVIYNLSQLRLMWEFPSQGTPALGGTNWTSTSTAAGDFEPWRVNSDIVEEVYRSVSKTVFLTCDTGLSQGATIDTVAILGHNLTKGASVVLQGSDDIAFGTINFAADLTVELQNMYYISPDFPTAAQQNRYWRFYISDTTNPDGHIQIGIIRFGAARIFSTKDNWENPLTRGRRHFKDVLPTEGFTNAMNDRALKKHLRLRFSQMEIFNNNFAILEEMQDVARTSLKVLVIPIPRKASQFALYGKLTELPEITQTSLDEESASKTDNGNAFEYADVELAWDESL